MYVEYFMWVRQALDHRCLDKQKTPCLYAYAMHRRAQASRWESREQLLCESSSWTLHSSKCTRCTSNLIVTKSVDNRWGNCDYECAWGHTAGKRQSWAVKPRQSVLNPKLKQNQNSWLDTTGRCHRGNEQDALREELSSGRALLRRWRWWKEWQPCESKKKDCVKITCMLP